MNIEVVLAYKERQYLVNLSMPVDSTIRQAVLAAYAQGLLPEDSQIDPDSVPLGVFGELEEDNYLLSEGERVEIYRPLLQDPKKRRRQRANETKNAK